jgi:predicted membrane protein
LRKKQRSATNICKIFDTQAVICHLRKNRPLHDLFFVLGLLFLCAACHDDLTLVIRLRHPASYLLAMTTFEVTFPQRGEVIEKIDSRWTNPENSAS